MSHDMRTTVTSHLLEELGMKRLVDVKSDLKPHQIQKDINQVYKFIEYLQRNINPFDCENLDKEHLYNKGTGRASSNEVADFLLNFIENGRLRKEQFIDECAESEDRFESTISKNKVLNFSSSNVRKRVQLKDKVTVVQMQRDLFGSMHAASLQNEENPDMEKLLTYPLTPIPLALCHLDGTI